MQEPADEMWSKNTIDFRSAPVVAGTTIIAYIVRHSELAPAVHDQRSRTVAAWRTEYISRLSVSNKNINSHISGLVP